jgi:hypothetical protein
MIDSACREQRRARSASGKLTRRLAGYRPVDDFSHPELLPAVLVIRRGLMHEQDRPVRFVDESFGTAAE